MVKPTTTTNQPKTVRLITYIQSLIIAVLVTAVISFIASYFFTIGLHTEARAAVISDIAVSKAQK